MGKIHSYFSKFQSIKDKIARVLSLLLLSFLIIKSVALAQEKIEEKYIPCFDAINSYTEAYTVSQKITGTTQSIDSSTRAGLVSKLLLINSMIYGTDSFCSSNNDSLSIDTTNGILGTLETQIHTSLNSTPEGNTFQYLAQEWIPGQKSQINAASGYSFLKDQIKLDTLWSFSRDIAYTLFVLVMIVIGFMVMFRRKINSQVYVNVMNSIPNVAVGLILVTFSFAIAGIFLDLGKVSIKVVGNIVYQISNNSPIEINSIGETFTKAMDVSAPEWKVAVPVAATSYVLARAAEKFNPAGGWGEGTAWMLVVNGIKLAASPITIASLIVLAKYAIIGLIVIYASIKLFLVIVTTYFKIFLDVITAPFYFLIGSIPGNTNLMVDWLKKMASNVLVFVLIFAIINFSWAIALSGILESNLNFFNENLTADIAPDWIITFKGILLIISYFFAANAPMLADSILSVKRSRTMSEASGKSKQSFSKIPLVGGLMSK